MLVFPYAPWLGCGGLIENEMNREIIFRGKRVDGKGWVEGYLWGIPTGVYIFQRGGELSVHLDSFEVDPATVGQFTGLTDKNGQKIWEGDIIKTPNNDWGVMVYKAPFFEVTVSETESSLYSREWFDGAEVIGNIHDNPELLRQ